LVKVKQNPKIQILENHRAIDLLMVGEGSETEKGTILCRRLCTD